MKTINGFDFDGVVSIGICPGPDDVIITGRSFDEAAYVNSVLKNRNIFNAVFFNPITTADRETGTERSRSCSGNHKARVINQLARNNIFVSIFFEDDEIQKEIIEAECKDQGVIVVHIVHDLTTK